MVSVADACERGLNRGRHLVAAVVADRVVNRLEAAGLGLAARRLQRVAELRLGAPRSRSASSVQRRSSASVGVS
jgi:hypothetical protein